MISVAIDIFDNTVFQMDGFDLDLTYITKELIALGLPSTGATGMYNF